MHSIETRKKISANHHDVSGKNNPMYGKKPSAETRALWSQQRKGNKNACGKRHSISGENNPNWRGGGEVPCAFCGKEIWKRPYNILGQENLFCSRECMGKWQSQDDEFIRKIMKSCAIKPNKREMELQALFELTGFPYTYVGDGRLILGGKCPDYVNFRGRNKLIELYGDYWHRGEDPNERIEYFSEFGFDTLVIWESELKDKNLLLSRLERFEEEINGNARRKTKSLSRVKRLD